MKKMLIAAAMSLAILGGSAFAAQETEAGWGRRVIAGITAVIIGCSTETNTGTGPEAKLSGAAVR
jgi:hypothetical protein